MTEKDKHLHEDDYFSTGSKSSSREGDFVDYRELVSGYPHKQARPKTDYYFKDYPYVRPTQDAFDRKEVKDSILFDKTKMAKLEDDEKPLRDASILISGFGMRNVDSFEKLVHMSHDERKKWELRKLWRDQYGKSIKSREDERLIKTSATSPEPSARTVTTEISTRSEKSSSDFLTQTETTDKTGVTRQELKRLDYLMGLETEMEEESEPLAEVKTEESKDDFKYASSKPVREAQRYLRVHRIFECFQFIAAHLLSARAENPIEFILNLLNRCLLYRSGLGSAPLLYEHHHIKKLFDLMDKLQTGLIDMAQYVTGMKTLGICTYNEDPELNDEGLITKDTFVEEAYEAELAIFEDLIKRRQEKDKKKIKHRALEFDSVSIPSLKPPYFIPSDLLKFEKSQVDMGQSGKHLPSGITDFSGEMSESFEEE